jgi:hypothetical protein
MGTVLQALEIILTYNTLFFQLALKQKRKTVIHALMYFITVLQVEFPLSEIPKSENLQDPKLFACWREHCCTDVDACK